MGDKQKMVRIFSIDGNISSGKSTIIERIKELSYFYKDDYITIIAQEPVDDWEALKDENDKNILECFYSDKAKYSFSFQINALFTRYKHFKQVYEEAKQLERYSGKKVIIITERTIDTDFFVFASSLYKNKFISDLDFKIYKGWYDEFKSSFPIDTAIYIDTTPENCHLRVKQRNRDGEDKIELKYLLELHEAHQVYLNEIKNKRVVVKVDGNVDMNKQSKEYTNNLETILDTIYETDEIIKFGEIFSKIEHTPLKYTPLEYVGMFSIGLTITLGLVSLVEMIKKVK